MRTELLVSALLILSAPTSHAAQTIALKGDVEVTFDVLAGSFRTDSLDLTGNVRFVQGPNSIIADHATASDTRSDKVNWKFDGGVHIQTNEADLKSDTASALFEAGAIANAKIQGSPAHFEQRGVPADQQVRGRANHIEYDFHAGLVTLMNDVWFTHGRDQEFSGCTVVYNVRDESVRANCDGQGSGRVKGIIRPRRKSGNTIGENTPDSSPQTQVASESGS